MTTYDRDLDAIARTARRLIDDVRAGEPAVTAAVLANLCRAEPGRMAQVMMALAAWVGPDVTDEELIERSKPTMIIDEIAVERLMSGDQCEATIEERREAAKRLDAQGVSAWEIGELVGVNPRTVTRWRRMWQVVA